jgi:FtsZ-interacting cell division protein ZipA
MNDLQLITIFLFIIVIIIITILAYSGRKNEFKDFFLMVFNKQYREEAQKDNEGRL